jgi:predicted membrane protein
MYHRKTLRRYLAYLFYVHTNMSGALMMFIAAALELACGAALGWDNPIAILGWFAAVFFAVVAVCMLWSVYRFERRHG